LIDPVDYGRIVVEGESHRARRRPDRIRRRIGIVFQAFNLFPHMSGCADVTLAPQVALASPARRPSAAGSSCSRASGSPTGAASTRIGCRAGSSSASRSVRAARDGARPDAARRVTSALDPELVAEVLEVIRELGRRMTM